MWLAVYYVMQCIWIHNQYSYFIFLLCHVNRWWFGAWCVFWCDFWETCTAFISSFSKPAIFRTKLLLSAIFGWRDVSSIHVLWFQFIASFSFHTGVLLVAGCCRWFNRNQSVLTKPCIPTSPNNSWNCPRWKNSWGKLSGRVSSREIVPKELGGEGCRRPWLKNG